MSARADFPSNHDFDYDAVAARFRELGCDRRMRTYESMGDEFGCSASAIRNALRRSGL